MRPDLDLEIHYSEEWAALYVNGQLNTVGDSYVAEEKAFELLGVKTIQDESFMRGQNSREGVAKSLEEIKTYQEDQLEEEKALRKKVLQEKIVQLENELKQL